MITSLIIDDEAHNLRNIKNLLEEHCPIITIIGQCSSADEALIAIRENQPQLIFLDVKMMNLDGVETAKIIRGMNKDVVICFATSYEDYAINAFHVEAIDYLIKPVAYDKMKRILDRGIINIRYCRDRDQSDKRYLTIKNQSEDILIDTNTIIYIEKVKNQCIFHTESDIVKCYESLGNLKDKLDKTQFVFSHQGYIINFFKVKEVKKNSVCFGGGIEVPVSRKHYNSLRELHLDKINRLRNDRGQTIPTSFFYES